MILKMLHPARIQRGAVGLLILCVALAGTGPAQGAGIPIDYLYPEAFRTQTWIDVDLPSDRVILENLRILTANRNWTLKICESTVDPSSCTLIVGTTGPPAIGWRGDFRNKTWTKSYEDRQAGKKLHLQVNPVGGDWMIFRIQVEVTALP
jgi:hypothetical protein